MLYSVDLKIISSGHAIMLYEWLIRKLGHDITALIYSFLYNRKFIPQLPYKAAAISNRDFRESDFYVKYKGEWMTGIKRECKNNYSGSLSPMEMSIKHRLAKSVKLKFENNQ